MQGQAHQLKLSEDKNLKLFLDLVPGKKLRWAEMTAAGVIDDNVEMARFRKRIFECFVDRTRIAQIESDRMQSRRLRSARRISRCSPNFVAAGGEQVCNGEADAGAGPCYENLSHWPGRIVSNWKLEFVTRFIGTQTMITPSHGEYDQERRARCHLCDKSVEQCTEG